MNGEILLNGKPWLMRAALDQDCDPESIFTAASARRMRETMQGILARDGNHPSSVIWTLFNEDRGTRLCEDPAHRAWLKDPCDWLKERGPTRLVVENSPCHGNFHANSDLNDFHHCRSLPERRTERDALTAYDTPGLPRGSDSLLPNINLVPRHGTRWPGNGGRGCAGLIGRLNIRNYDTSPVVR